MDTIVLVTQGPGISRYYIDLVLQMYSGLGSGMFDYTSLLWIQLFLPLKWRSKNIKRNIVNCTDTWCFRKFNYVSIKQCYTGYRDYSTFEIIYCLIWCLKINSWHDNYHHLQSLCYLWCRFVCHVFFIRQWQNIRDISEIKQKWVKHASGLDNFYACYGAGNGIRGEGWGWLRANWKV